MQKLNRRRFLSISAAAAGTLALGGKAATTPLFRWRGAALGAAASITLRHPDAQRITEAAQMEIARLEAIFSLYREDSALTRLNVTGRLVDPPFELLELTSLCAIVHSATGGLFDPTVQPLWETYASHYADGRAPGDNSIDMALARVGWPAVTVSPAAIAFERDGMAITLNGVAQGYIADRVAELLRAEGLTDILVDTGEMRAIGGYPDGGGWPVSIGWEASANQEQLRLTNMALASSEPLGTAFDAAGAVGHILNPLTGRPADARWKLVSVMAPSAALADALTTAMCLMSRAEMTSVLSRFPAARLVHLA